MRLLILTGLLLTSPLIQALTFRLDGDEVVGNSLEIEARYEDTFVHLGRVYGLGYRELMDANPGYPPGCLATRRRYTCRWPLFCPTRA